MRYNTYLTLIFVLMLAVGGRVSAQDSSGAIPAALLRPMRTEAPRYPLDSVVGELGKGTAPDGAYTAARTVAADLFAQRREAKSLAGIEKSARDGAFEKAAAVGARKFRIGGCREEPDGQFSFLCRFIGRETDAVGELYLAQENGAWRLDQIVLEEGVSPERRLKDGDKGYPPYGRFY
jgi:hypothetical protein